MCRVGLSGGFFFSKFSNFNFNFFFGGLPCLSLELGGIESPLKNRH